MIRIRAQRGLYLGTLAAIVVAALALIFVVYSYRTTDHIGQTAATEGTSTRPNEPGSIQDRQQAGSPKTPPLTDTNVPPRLSVVAAICNVSIPEQRPGPGVESTFLCSSVKSISPTAPRAYWKAS